MNAAVPDALFDLAINRARGSICTRFARPMWPRALAQWHARTRFARRIPLSTIETCLLSLPTGEWHWQGGEKGGWQQGKADFP